MNQMKSFKPAKLLMVSDNEPYVISDDTIKIGDDFLAWSGDSENGKWRSYTCTGFEQNKTMILHKLGGMNVFTHRCKLIVGSPEQFAMFFDNETNSYLSIDSELAITMLATILQSDGKCNVEIVLTNKEGREAGISLDEFIEMLEDSKGFGSEEFEEKDLEDPNCYFWKSKKHEGKIIIKP